MIKIKRNDLAKQFELVVQQEITNHNSSILATNQAINVMRERIDILLQKFAEHASRNEAWFKKTQEEFLKLEREFDKRISENKSRNHVLNEKLDNSSKYIWEGIEKVESNYIEKEEFKEYKDSLNMEVTESKQMISDQNKYLRAALYKIKNDLEKMHTSFTKEILDKPDDLWEVKEELEKKIQESVIDSKGVLREIQIYKKSAFIIEKKIEDLYKLILE